MLRRQDHALVLSSEVPPFRRRTTVATSAHKPDSIGRCAFERRQPLSKMEVIAVLTVARASETLLNAQTSSDPLGVDCGRSLCGIPRKPAAPVHVACTQHMTCKIGPAPYLYLWVDLRMLRVLARQHTGDGSSIVSNVKIQITFPHRGEANGV